MSSTTKNTDAAAGNNANTSPHIAENTSQKYQPDESSDSDGSRVNPSEKCDETILPGYVIEYYTPQVGIPGGKRCVHNATISSLCPNLSPPVNGDNHSSFKDAVVRKAFRRENLLRCGHFRQGTFSPRSKVNYQKQLEGE